jgi:hypothetical protein
MKAAKKKKKRKPKKKAAGAQNGEKSNANVVKGKSIAYYDVILALNSWLYRNIKPFKRIRDARLVKTIKFHL